MWRFGAGLAAVLTGCASAPPYEGPRSGFLTDQDYSLLQKKEAPGGGDRYVYISESFTPAKYQALLLESLQYFPAPEPSNDVTMQALMQIRDYADQTLRAKIGQKVRLLEQPGPGVARERIALTAVGIETRSLKPYQYIPVALVVTGAKAAAQGGLPRDSNIALENEVTDSMTGEPLLAAVRGGSGERVAADAQGTKSVTLEDLNPLIDRWSDAAAVDVTQYIQAK